MREVLISHCDEHQFKAPAISHRVRLQFRIPYLDYRSCSKRPILRAAIRQSLQIDACSLLLSLDTCAINLNESRGKMPHSARRRERSRFR